MELRTAEKDEKLIKILGSDLFKELDKQVNRIENGIQTTQNHYGDYMGILGRIPKQQHKNIALLLIYFGGNVEGIKSALQVV